MAVRRAPPKSTVDDIPRSTDAPNAFKSPAPAVVVQCWIGLVEHMDRAHLDRFTRSTWRRFRVDPVRQQQRGCELEDVEHALNRATSGGGHSVTGRPDRSGSALPR